MVGAQRVDRHAGDDGRVDAARQADDHIGETVLAHVVAGAQHDRLIQLGIGRQRRGHARRDRLVVHDGMLGYQQRGHRLNGHATPGVQQALAIDGLDLDIGDHQFLDELRGAGDERAVGVEHHRSPVEHQLVLPAHLVHVHQRAAGIGGTGGQHALAPGHLAGVERRAIDVDVQFCTAGGLMCQRSGGAPHVFADADAHLHTTDHVQLVRIVHVAGCEVAGLVEDGVVGQQPFAIRADHFAVGAHRSGVVQIAIRVDEPHYRCTTTGARGQLVEGDLVVGHEPWLQHQVFRRVPSDRQFGKSDDVASGRVGLVVGRDDLGQVGVDGANGRIDLGQGNAQASHAIRLAGQVQQDPSRLPSPS